VIEHVAIVGCGFSGALQAINLHRHGGPRATLIERSSEPGKGLAYGAAHPMHLLNVRASRMSAFPDDPDHFVRWLESRGVQDARTAFVPRITYGAYLRALLQAAARDANGRIEILEDRVDDVEGGPDGARLRLESGRTVEADAAVLAIGNLPPHAPAGLGEGQLTAPRYIADPWAGGIPDGLGADDTVLVIGTGLTMVDVVLLLDSAGFPGKIVAMSRRGLLPHVHAGDSPAPPPISVRPAGRASEIVRAVRARAEAIGWRDAVDELRPFTQGMWRAAPEAERRRFLRHLRPWWDIHRHRIAPEVAARLQRMQDEGRLQVIAGKPQAFVERGHGAEVTYRPRGASETQTLLVQRVVNCTGPQGDLKRSDDPLLRRLAQRGLIRADAQHLGIDVDPQARTIAADGTPNEWLLALGPLTRGAFWEIIAVPDIRAQTWTVARHFSNAHWVEGEGL
jgi:uncharacterized NAD(P)/FAD-binding protein YdhS